MGRAAWQGFVCFYRSNDLTFASSVAFYALLSLFPFLLLSLSILGRVSADDHDRAAILGFVLQYFPRQFDFVTVQLDAFRSCELRGRQECWKDVEGRNGAVEPSRLQPPRPVQDEGHANAAFLH